MTIRIFASTVTVAALALASTACSRNGNSPAGENRPDAKAVGRAAEVTNTTDNREPASAGTSGTLERSADQASRAAADAGLTLKVQAKFMQDDVVKARHINVDSNDGVVVLKGTVRSKAESERADQLARETDGVKRVVNDLKVDAAAE